MKRFLVVLVIMVGVSLTACSPIVSRDVGTAPPVTVSAPEVVTQAPVPTATDSPSAGGPQDLRPIPIDHVQILSGYASPIPALVLVSGTWPDLCAQLAQVDLKPVEGDQIEIALLATPADPTCPPDVLGLPFRLEIPLNWGELPEGAYTVRVNGQQTTLHVPVIPPPADPQTGEPVLGVPLTPAPGASSSAPAKPAPSAATAGEPIAVPVEAVNVQIGVGSPIPVEIQVAAGWPSLCAQLANISQQLDQFELTIDIQAYAGRADCPPDYVGYGFGLNIPINVVELPEGTYTVSVNGVETTLSVPVTPPADEPVGGPSNGSMAQCPELGRPALALYGPGDAYALVDPATGQMCPLVFEGALPGMVTMVGDDFFVASRTIGPEGEAAVILRYRPDGTFEDLPYTMVDAQAGSEMVAFAISGDAGLIAWSVLGPTGGPDEVSTTLSIADLATGQVVAGLAPAAGAAPGALMPIRFSGDGHVLYYGLQPYGLGGIWSSYAGRYDNLYAVPIDGNGHPELIFDCAELDQGLCLGDFFEVAGEVTALAYVDRAAGAVIIENGDRDVINSFTSEQEYIGYPTWGPSGELVYYTAELSSDANASPLPAMGTLHRVAPPTAPAEALVSERAVLLPVRFINETQVVVMWAGDNGERRLALVGVDGAVELLNAPGDAMLLGGPAASALLGVAGSGGLVGIP